MEEKYKKLNAENEELKTSLINLVKRYESELMNIHEKNGYYKQSWKSIKLQYEQRWKRFLEADKIIHSTQNHCDSCRKIRCPGEYRQIRKENESEQNEKLILEQRLQEMGQKMSKMEQDLNLAYHSLELERKEFEEKEKIMKDKLQDSERELKRVQKLLLEQQRVMGEIKQISKSSFQKVNKSHTLDNVESFKKDLAIAQALNEQTQERREFINRLEKKPYGYNQYSDESSSNQSPQPSEEYFDSRSSGDSSYLPLQITSNKRRNNVSKNNLQTIIKTTHVHNYNYPSSIENKTEQPSVLNESLQDVVI